MSKLEPNIGTGTGQCFICCAPRVFYLRFFSLLFLLLFLTIYLQMNNIYGLFLNSNYVSKSSKLAASVLVYGNYFFFFLVGYIILWFYFRNMKINFYLASNI